MDLGTDLKDERTALGFALALFLVISLSDSVLWNSDVKLLLQEK